MTPSIAGIGDENVELAPALVDRAAEPVDARHVGEVERHQRRLPPAALISSSSSSSPPDGARDGDHMRARRREMLGGEIADAARGAGDERDAAGEVGEGGHAKAHRPEGQAERRR